MYKMGEMVRMMLVLNTYLMVNESINMIKCANRYSWYPT